MGLFLILVIYTARMRNAIDVFTALRANISPIYSKFEGYNLLISRLKRFSNNVLLSVVLSTNFISLFLQV